MNQRAMNKRDMNSPWPCLTFMAICLLLPACREEVPQKGTYQYSVSSWQGTHIYSERYAKTIGKARNLICEANRHSGLPGAQIAVAIDGKICWSENFGFADLQAGAPVKHNTIFRIASVSKLFTASAIGKLLEEGKLDLDTPVTRYLPQLPSSYSSITIRHLVSHQSGIRHYYGADKPEKTEHYADVNDALPLFVDAPLLFAPGQNCEYSSYGWAVLGAVVQEVTGKPFLEYMQASIWQPLGLTNTFGPIPPRRSKDVTRFYVKTAPEASWQEAPYQDLSFNWAGAGLSSNANDLALFGTGLLYNQLLNAKTMRQMYEPQLTTRKDTTGFGIGFTLYRTADNEPILGHGGFMPTAKSYLLLFPASGLVISFTANTAMVNFSDETLVEIAHMFIQEKKDADCFLFNRSLHRNWTGLWQLESQTHSGDYQALYLHLYEQSNELKATVLSVDQPPVEAQLTALKKDSLQLLVPFASHTACLRLGLSQGKLSGVNQYNKPLSYQIRKKLKKQQPMEEMLKPKAIKNGKKYADSFVPF